MDYLSTKALKRKGENLFSDTKRTQHCVMLEVRPEKDVSGPCGAKEKEDGL